MKSLPEIDECRFILLKILEQSIRDFLCLSKSAAPIEQHYYETARDFLFDPDYTIVYGDNEKSLSDLLDILGLDIEWFRIRIMKLKNQKVKEFKIKRMLNHDYEEKDYP